MSAPRIYKFLTLLITITLLAAACGSPQLDETAMSTAVALTVEAQLFPEGDPVSPSPIPTNSPSPLASIPPTTSTETAVPQIAAGNCTASASLVGETYPDGTIVQPGETFTKIWQIQNSGTCTWDSTWQLIFFSGELMDGLTVYNFPQPAQPGQTVDVPVILMSGHPREALLATHHLKESVPFVQKPFTLREMMETVAAVCGEGDASTLGPAPVGH